MIRIRSKPRRVPGKPLSKAKNADYSLRYRGRGRVYLDSGEIDSTEPRRDSDGELGSGRRAGPGLEEYLGQHGGTVQQLLGGVGRSETWAP
ncbi:hypothetical protein N7468_007686 [Penicillium chermesinum]|uniref:Uncharacterized protein n=1 Tax=Penicillium chermesinum TaxID=63820 RepID=A0A9W9TKT1_9EURO|nr:uncharacterized protein N7468_007686 [Penicillium chermesinum]KAJ5226461.1 hypothetical protein N7468_007686 [Penicillium chermesinum]